MNAMTIKELTINANTYLNNQELSLAKEILDKQQSIFSTLSKKESVIDRVMTSLSTALSDYDLCLDSDLFYRVYHENDARVCQTVYKKNSKHHQLFVASYIAYKYAKSLAN